MTADLTALLRELTGDLRAEVSRYRDLAIISDRDSESAGPFERGTAFGLGLAAKRVEAALAGRPQKEQSVNYKNEYHAILKACSDNGVSDTDDVPLSDVVRGALSQLREENDSLRDNNARVKALYDARGVVNACGLTANDIYHVMLAWERMPASEEQTRIVIGLGKLREAFIQRGDSRYVTELAPTAALAGRPPDKTPFFNEQGGRINAELNDAVNATMERIAKSALSPSVAQCPSLFAFGPIYDLVARWALAGRPEPPALRRYWATASSHPSWPEPVQMYVASEVDEALRAGRPEGTPPDDSWEAFCTDLFNLVMRNFEWVRAQGGRHNVCPLCHAVSIRDGGPDHQDDCPRFAFAKRFDALRADGRASMPPTTKEQP